MQYSVLHQEASHVERNNETCQVQLYNTAEGKVNSKVNEPPQHVFDLGSFLHSIGGLIPFANSLLKV